MLPDLKQVETIVELPKGRVKSGKVLSFNIGRKKGAGLRF